MCVFIMVSMLVDNDDVIVYCKIYLMNYKIFKCIIVLEEFFKLMVGKIFCRELRLV